MEKSTEGEGVMKETQHAAASNGNDQGKLPKAEGKPPAFVCADCRFPICEESELIEEPTECWKEQVYGYRLELLDRDDVAVYSATNPSAHRFDVVRVLPNSIGVYTDLSDEPTPEHSWFPGFGWRMAHCARCSSHLGWSFSATPETPETETSEESSEDAETSKKRERKEKEPRAVQFHGIIVTRLREDRNLSRQDLDDARQVTVQQIASGRGPMLLRRLRQWRGSGSDTSALLASTTARARDALRSVLASVASVARVRSSHAAGAGVETELLQDNLNAFQEGLLEFEDEDEDEDADSDADADEDEDEENEEEVRNEEMPVLGEAAMEEVEHGIRRAAARGAVSEQQQRAWAEEARAEEEEEEEEEEEGREVTQQARA